MSAEVYDSGILVESWDDTTRTHTDHTTEPPTVRPYTEAENAAADQAIADDARLDDHEVRIAALEAAMWPAPPDPTDPDDPTVPTWADYGGVWPNQGLLAEGGTVWRNVSGVPLTTSPSGFPGEPGQWAHLFVAVLGTDTPPPPDAPAWDGDSHAYAVGDLVTYEGSVYRCAQAHTSQAGWTPVAVPSLWTIQP